MERVNEDGGWRVAEVAWRSCTLTHSFARF